MPDKSTSILTPGAVTQDATGSTDWTGMTVANVATAFDGFSAQASGVTSTKSLLLTNFNFNIPSGAKVLGIAVTLYTASNDNGSDQTLYLYNGSNLGANKAKINTLIPTSTTASNYGGTTDLWSATLTPAIINSSSFGISYAAVPFNAPDILVNVDRADMRVYYSITTTRHVQWF